MRAVTEALRLDPDDADTHLLRAVILRRLGRPTESVASYEEALRLDPGHAVALHGLAVSRLTRWRLAAALRGFLGAAALDPTLGETVRTNIAVLIVRLTAAISVAVAAEGMLAVHLPFRSSRR